MSNAQAPAQTSPKQRAWAQFKRWAPWALSALVLVLIGRQVHTIDWPQVWQALQQQPRSGLAAAAGLALCSYLLFAAYDLVGRQVTGHRVSVPRSLGIAATCYAFNVNFGALVGALAVKLRLYERSGLKTGVTARVIGLSIVTNWLGYLAVGGAVLLLAPPPLPPQLPLGEAGVRTLGAAMLAAAAAYMVLSATGPEGGRRLAWRGHEVLLPNGRMALWQLLLSAANWSLMGVIVWLLLDGRLAYPTVLGVLLLAAIAGVVTHVPAGLGVMEAVFIASLGTQLPQPTLVAALLAYRATYYLLPLALATAGYLLSLGNSKADGASLSDS